jgi:predicted Zn-dependent peptidase
MKQTVAVAALLVMHASFAFAQKQQPPAGGTPRDFTLPAATTFTLDNGLRATLVPYGSIPKVAVSISVFAGNYDESETEDGLAEVVGTLLKEGTATRSAKKIAEEAAGMGGDVNVSVTGERTLVSGGALSEFAPAFVALLGDVVMHPAFPASELERIKTDQLRQLAIIRTQPGVIAQIEFMKVLYKGYPQGRGLPEDAIVRGFTLADVRRFYDAHFGASRAHVYVAGRFDVKQIEEAIRKEFGGWQKGAGPSLAAAKPFSSRAIYLVDRPGAPQSTIRLGLPVKDPSQGGYRALQVTNALLGGSFSSRITANIRENKGYTYSPNSSVTSGYRSAHWTQAADVSTPVTGASLKEIFFEVDRLQAEAPSEAELGAIKNYLAGVFVLQNSNPASIIGQLQFLDLHGLPRSFLDEAVKQIHAVTPEDVRSVMNEQIRDTDMTIVIVGDRKVIQKQVAPYGRIMN